MTFNLFFFGERETDIYGLFGRAKAAVKAMAKSIIRKRRRGERELFIASKLEKSKMKRTNPLKNCGHPS